jgi:hypothetical protein
MRRLVALVLLHMRQVGGVGLVKGETTSRKVTLSRLSRHIVEIMILDDLICKYMYTKQHLRRLHVYILLFVLAWRLVS